MSEEKGATTKDNREGDVMNEAALKKTGYKKLDLSTLNFADKIITSDEALRNATPLEWSEKVLSGEKKVVIKKR